jgi:FlaG/FlaF family flagellin (archaellin)
MTKFAKLSLAVSLLLGSSIYANTLEQAFKASKVKGEIRAEYSNSNFLGQSKSDGISTVGGNLGIITGSFYGFSFGGTFQTSHVINLTNHNNVFSGTPPLHNDALDVQGSVLSEAYLNYTFKNTSLKAGRQYIYTPLVSTALDGKSSEGLIKDSFEAYMLTNTDIPNTTVVAGYLSKYQAKRDANGGFGNFDNIQDGAYMVYVKNTSVKNLTLSAQYLNINGKIAANDKNALYLQADYKIGSHTLSAQYLKSKDKSQTNQDGQAFGVRATGALGIGKLGYYFGFDTTSNDGPVYYGLGAGTSDTLFTAVPVDGGGVPARANTDTVVGAVVVPVVGITFIPYIGESFRNTGLGNVVAVGALAIYPYGKHFLVKADYEHINLENTVPGIPNQNTDVARLHLSYKF